MRTVLIDVCSGIFFKQLFGTTVLTLILLIFQGYFATSPILVLSTCFLLCDIISMGHSVHMS